MFKKKLASVSLFQILTVAQNVVGLTKLTELLGAPWLSVATRMKFQCKASISGKIKEEKL